MTSSVCSNCGRECVVGLQHSVRWGSRWIQWRLCVSCHLAEEARNARDRADDARQAPVKRRKAS